ncbi:MAG: nitroreductase family protein [Chloroflexi bacterium]|nr:nitroreductase family protein [Chloroflexota bacterium]
MDVWEAINSVRVIRDFAEQPLSAEHEARILNAARRTGSSKNEQTWAFIVIHDRDHLRELTGVGKYADHIAGAAMAVALVTPDESAGWRNTRMWDLGRAAQSMVLAAWELGIGSAPATSSSRTWLVSCSACRRTGAATTCCRSATPPTRRSSRRRTRPAAGSHSRP